MANFLKGGGDHLYRNDNGHFKEVNKEAGIHGGLISFGLGVSVGDVNNDGWPDIYVSNDSYERDYCYINQQNGTFKDDFENCFSQTTFHLWVQIWVTLTTMVILKFLQLICCLKMIIV